MTTLQSQQQDPSWANPFSVTATTYTNGRDNGISQDTYHVASAVTQSHVGSPAPVPDSYFAESRKGEVNELRQLLRTVSTEKDLTRQREIVKKVIAYMTLGIDVSRLFSDVMLLVETRDLVVKKMVYLFLTNYATSHPDLARMCTNTLQKDCGNDDPMVRGLALRALCGIPLPPMVEYIAEPLRRSLTDPHAYVRKTGVMGTLKLFHLDAATFESHKFRDVLYDMLLDPDSSVVSNCLLVLNEVMSQGPHGGMAVNRAIMLHLLNRLHEFSEFGVVAVLDLVPRYVPANDEEGYQIMNLLDPLLRTSNAGAFLAVVFAFISLAEHLGRANDNAQAIRVRIVHRVRAPLVTLVTGGSHELAYALLRHVDALIELCPGTFDEEYRQFFVRWNEPGPVRHLKIVLLGKLANPSNAPDIVAELSECASDVDVTLGRLAVRSLAHIARRDVGGDGCAESIVRRLVDMLDGDVDHVRSEAAMALVDTVRMHPHLRGVVSPPLSRALRCVVDPSGRAAIVHLLSACGDLVRDAPYALERLIDTYEHIGDVRVKIALLHATVRLFFARPPEVKDMLGRLLAQATEDVSSRDVHDRALLYYRLLRTADPRVVESVLVSDAGHILSGSGGVGFAEENLNDYVRGGILKEFNSLSVLYGSTSENFIREEHRMKFVRMSPEDHPIVDDGVLHKDLSVNKVFGDEVQQMGLLSGDACGAGVNTVISVPPVSEDADVDLLGFGNESVASSPTPCVTHNNFMPMLDPSIELTGDEYQTKWSLVPDAHAFITSIPLHLLPPSTETVEASLAKKAVHTMASGDLPSELRFFWYAQEIGDDIVFLAQANILKGKEGKVDLVLTVKSYSGAEGQDMKRVLGFVDVIKDALQTF